MARIRSVHPELFTDEAFCSLSPHARLLAIGIWTLCDDQGVFEWKPFGLKINVAPADAVDIPALLGELVAQNQIKKFEADGRTFGAVRNFCKYQRPKKLVYKHELPAELRTYVLIDARVSLQGDTKEPPKRGSKPKKPRVVAPQGPLSPRISPHRRGEEGSGSGEDNLKTNIESRERVPPATSEAPPAAPSDSRSKVQNASKEVKKPSLRALGTALPETWTPDEETQSTVKAEYGMTDEDIRSELLAFHALNASEGTYSANWQKAFVMFCKRWKEHRDKRAPARVELSKAPANFVPTEADWDSQAKIYAQSGRWSHQFGPDPTSPACRCPPHILERHIVNHAAVPVLANRPKAVAS